MANLNIVFPSGVSTYVTDASNFIGEKVSVSGQTLYDVNYCGDAALYYLNSRGGYDAFLIEGLVKRTDKYTQGDLYRAYDNRDIQHGRNRYITEITPSWELHTSWLKDDEAERLVRNLFPSTRVWLHLLDTNEYFPVVITDTSAEYKTYRNGGERLVSYTIKVDGSQTADRR